MKISNESINGYVVVRLEGRLDAAMTKELHDQLLGLAADAGKGLVLNMEKIDFLDSSGLGFIVTLYKRTVEKGSALKLASLTPQVQSLMELTRMTKILSIFPSEEDALA